MPRPAPPAAELAVREGRALGSQLRLLAADSAGIDAAWRAVVTEFAAVDMAMSRFRADSEITRLNQRDASVTAVSRRLRLALALSDRARRMSSGRFDPRVLRSMERLGFTGATLSPADTEDRAPEGRISCGAGLDGRSAHLRLAVPVDLGGIGKGLALRWAADAAERTLRGDSCWTRAATSFRGRPHRDAAGTAHGRSASKTRSGARSRWRSAASAAAWRSRHRPPAWANA